MVSGNDATVKAGSYYPITVIKSYRCQEISEMIRLPTVYMPDSGGAFLPLQVNYKMILILPTCQSIQANTLNFGFCPSLKYFPTKSMEVGRFITKL